MARRKILAIDDNVDVTHYLAARLHSDYDVVSVNDPQRALEVARAERPDLVLLDVEMPGIDGIALCRQLKADHELREIPVIFLTVLEGAEFEKRGLEVGAVDYIHKKSDRSVLEARIRAHLALRIMQSSLREQNVALEAKVAARTAELETSREALRSAMHNLRTTRVAAGVYWVQVPEAAIYILCGSPPDVVKHLMLRGYIADARIEGVSCETGPNVILLSETSLQDGYFANLAEFPVLQMLYRQGMLLPGHPGNTGAKPMLIGVESQVRAQLEYIYRGNYGLASHEELLAAGLGEKEARQHMALKLGFAFGRIRSSEELLETRALGSEPTELARGVSARRTGFNRYEFGFRGQRTEVDFNLSPDENYQAPYALGHHRIDPQYFAVVHIGEGDGWDVRRQCMGSIVVFQGSYYLVDAAPNIGDTLRSLGIDPSEIEGIFHTHAHDDHFAGLATLLGSGRRIKYFATRLVRSSVAKKLAALMSMDESLFEDFFEVHDLHPGLWNDCDGLEVMPLDSPHPVETTAFVFRARDDGGEKTYAHLADIVSRGVLECMLSQPGVRDALPADYLETVFAGYLAPANVKKLDAGGGLIHGDPLDFVADRSGKIILAHRATHFTREERELGSYATFGAIETLIATRQDYIGQRAYRLLRDIFPDAGMSRLNMLLRSPVISLNAGSLLLRHDREVGFVYLILTGTVARARPASEERLMLSTGDLVGAEALFAELPARGAWHAMSSVRLLRIGIDTFRAFLVAGGWHESLRQQIVEQAPLADSWLLGASIDFSTRTRISQISRSTTLGDAEELSLTGHPHVQLVRHGALERRDRGGRLLETVMPGGFVGEDTCLDRPPSAAKCIALGATGLLAIPASAARSIPVVLWKLLQTYERRARRDGTLAPAREEKGR